MTLIVSLRILDGIVIAGDSLSTMMTQGQGQPPVPAATFSYAQKVFPFCKKFGVGTFGTGLLAGKSIYFAMRLLEQTLQDSETDCGGITEAAKQIGDEIYELVKEQLRLDNISIEMLPDDQIILGFQIVGYDDTQPKTINLHIGKQVSVQVYDQLGCTIAGSQEVVQAIWGLYHQQPQSQPPYQIFSLQDAIDYAEFLIRTTIDHQRFSQTIPNVGGDIDMALVTLFDGFRWIRQKPIGRVLEGRQNETDINY